jgi:hypothetical protein
VNEPVRYRFARRSERFEPYAFMLAWPVLWFGPPLGIWVWLVVFLPDICNVIIRKAWRGLPAVVASTRRSESGVELEGPNGQTLRIAFSDVDSLTAIFDKNGRTTDVRLDRKSGRALVFEVVGDDNVATLATRLGLDVSKARSRYTLATLIAPWGLSVLLSGVAIAFGSPFVDLAPETRSWLASYVNFVVLPVLVLYAIGTQLDVGRDGIAWRWLFVRKYLPFSAIASVVTLPRDVPGDKIRILDIVRRDRATHRFVLGKQSGAAWFHVREAFGKSQTQKASEPTVDDWLRRANDETALAWTKRLQAIAASDTGYRGVSVAHLWSVAEDLDAPKPLRAGAALALGGSDAAREKLRILATQVVDPALSALLQAIASGAPPDELAMLVEAIGSSS